MWFNPDDLLTPAANSANPDVQISKLARLADPLPVKTSDSSLEISKLAELAEPNNLIVTCWTPAGNPVEVIARDRDHAEQLRRWNPEPEARPN